MNFDPALLDELGRVFVEAAMRRIESEFAEIEVVVGGASGHCAHLDGHGRATTRRKDGELDDK